MATNDDELGKELRIRRAKLIELESLNQAVDLLDIADAYQCLGDIHDERLEYDEARHYYQLALGAFEQAKPKSYEMAMIHTNLALADQKHGKCERALEHYQKALEIYEWIDPNSLDVADHCLYIGRQKQVDGVDVIQARPFLQRASLIYQRTNPNCENLAIAYYNLGATCAQKQGQEARQYFEKALEVLKRRKVSGSMRLANTHYALGLCYLNDSLERARRHFEAAGFIYHRVAPQSLVLACTYKHLGDIAKKQLQPVMACVAYLKSSEVYQNIDPSSS